MNRDEQRRRGRRMTMDDEWQWPPRMPKGMFWRLDENHTPVACETFEEYLAWGQELFAGGQGFPPHVDWTPITEDIYVSTVFLVSPAGAGFVKQPLFFETMVFGGPLDKVQCRYATWDEAAAGHQRLCEESRRLLALSPDELAAEMSARAEGELRFIRETALAIGLPEDIADKLSEAARRTLH
jgi:hypothetical protein